MPLFGVQQVQSGLSQAFASGMQQTVQAAKAGAEIKLARERQKEQARQFDALEPYRRSQANLMEQTAGMYGQLMQSRLENEATQRDATVQSMAQSQEAAALSLANAGLELAERQATFGERVAQVSLQTEALGSKLRASQTQEELSALELERATSPLGEQEWQSRTLASIQGSKAAQRDAYSRRQLSDDQLALDRELLEVQSAKLAGELAQMDASTDFMGFLATDGLPMLLEHLPAEAAEDIRDLLGQEGSPELKAARVQQVLQGASMLRGMQHLDRLEDNQVAMRVFESMEGYDPNDVPEHLLAGYQQAMQEQDYPKASVYSSRIVESQNRRYSARRSHAALVSDLEAAFAEQVELGGAGPMPASDDSFDSFDSNKSAFKVSPEVYIEQIRMRDPYGLDETERRNIYVSFIQRYGTDSQKALLRKVGADKPQGADVRPRGTSGVLSRQGVSVPLPVDVPEDKMTADIEAAKARL